jgi:hypothetical protein
MTLLAHQILNNPNINTIILNQMSVKGLKDMAIDIRAEVNAGLLSDTLASDRLNLIAGIMLKKEMEERENKVIN